VQVKEYDDIINDLIALRNNNSINTIWLSPSSNYATLSAIQVKLFAHKRYEHGALTVLPTMANTGKREVRRVPHSVDEVGQE
jgi:hypothetical protein